MEFHSQTGAQLLLASFPGFGRESGNEMSFLSLFHTEKESGNGAMRYE